MGRNGQKRLDQLISEVARGERQLSAIADPKLREAVRLALRLHEDAPAAPDSYAKARMRARVMAGLDPHKPTLLDNAWTMLELLARPAPYIVRGVAASSVLACLGMGAIVASADTLPDDLFYPLKLATEQVRLALADAPGDRASVELSIAEHRLAEAEKLAGNGRTSDALVASALYSQHIASAAAELAPQDEATGLGAQLETAFTAQRDRAQALAVTLAGDVKSARGAQILALIASPTYAPGQTKIEQVAMTAASVAQQLSVAADLAAAENESIPTPSPSGTATSSPSAPAFVPRLATAPVTTIATPPPTPADTATATPVPTAASTLTSTLAATTSTPATPNAPATPSAPTATANTAPTTAAVPSAPATSASAPSSPAGSTTSGTNTTSTTTSTTSTTNTTNTNNITTTTSGTTTAADTTRTSGRSTPEPRVTRDPHAQDAAKAAREAAEKAKAATERLREALKERESRGRGR